MLCKGQNKLHLKVHEPEFVRPVHESTGWAQCTADFLDLSDTFAVRKMQLLGGRRPPQEFLPAKGWPMLLGAAFGCPKDPGAAEGRLKVSFS